MRSIPEVGDNVVYELYKFKYLQSVSFDRCSHISNEVVQPLKDKSVEVVIYE